MICCFKLDQKKSQMIIKIKKSFRFNKVKVMIVIRQFLSIKIYQKNIKITYKITKKNKISKKNKINKKRKRINIKIKKIKINLERNSNNAHKVQKNKRKNKKSKKR